MTGIKTTTILSLLLVGLLMTACGLEITEQSPAARLTATASTAGAAEAQVGTAISPTALAALDLPGELIFISADEALQRLVSLDLASGTLTTLFRRPENSWLAAAALSPDQTQLVLVYAPPPPADTPLGFTNLYLLPADGSGSPRPLLAQTDPRDAYANPAWSPNGRAIYYTHFISPPAGSEAVASNAIERVAYPGGRPERLLEQARWPRLSPDGSKLLYLAATAETGTAEQLYLAEADGTQPRPVLPPGDFPIVDDHFFSPDGRMIIFSAPNEAAALAPSWLERLFGIRLALAHDLPSDWWRVPVAGGQHERLTQISAINLLGTYSPDGASIAFLSLDGLFIMNPDGSGLGQLRGAGPFGVLEWAP